MPQNRFYNYDSTATSGSENTINRVLSVKGVYEGLDLTVTPDNVLTVSPGYGLQHNGVVWHESTPVSISFTPTLGLVNYTVIATHDNRQIKGGVRVQYDLIADALAPDITGGVVIGWIYYPGGSGGILQEYCVSAPKQSPNAYASYLTKTKPLEILPPYPGSIVTHQDPDITVTPLAFDSGSFVLYQGVANAPAGPGVEQAIQQIQLYGWEGIRPTYIYFYFYSDAPPTTNLQVAVYGTDLLPVPVTGGPVVGAGPSWLSHYVAVNRTDGLFEHGKPYTIRLTYNVGLGREIRLGRIMVLFWPYPSAP